MIVYTRTWFDMIEYSYIISKIRLYPLIAINVILNINIPICLAYFSNSKQQDNLFYFLCMGWIITYIHILNIVNKVLLLLHSNIFFSFKPTGYWYRLYILSILMKTCSKVCLFLFFTSVNETVPWYLSSYLF